MNQELKEQARKEFEINNEALLLEYISRAYPSGNISKLYLEVRESLIDKTVQHEQDRIVGVIEKNRDDYGQRPYDWHGYKHASNDIISLITNKSDINK